MEKKRRRFHGFPSFLGGGFLHKYKSETSGVRLCSASRVETFRKMFINYVYSLKEIQAASLSTLCSNSALPETKMSYFQNAFSSDQWTASGNAN